MLGRSQTGALLENDVIRILLAPSALVHTVQCVLEEQSMLARDWNLAKHTKHHIRTIAKPYQSIAKPYQTHTIAIATPYQTHTTTIATPYQTHTKTIAKPCQNHTNIIPKPYQNMIWL
jgi:hypothetical protein